jgi:hypothetical protein
MRRKQMPLPEFSEVLSKENFYISYETFHLLLVTFYDIDSSVFTELTEMLHRHQPLSVSVGCLTLYVSVSPLEFPVWIATEVLRQTIINMFTG